MCGLVGAFGDLYADQIKAFNTMLIWNQVRGADSTGVGVIDYHTRNARVLKQLGRPDRLMNHEFYESAVNTRQVCIIGHGRHKTMGEVSLQNAHPFYFDNLIGAHNGTLAYTSKQWLDPKGEYGTDSEALYARIAESGAEEIIPQITGAWAMTWYDRVFNKLRFLRNSERPLWYVFVRDGKAMMWASEKGYLTAALERHGVKYEGPYELPINELWSWDVPKIGNQIQEAEIIPLEGKKYEQTKSSSFRGNANGSMAGNQWGWDEHGYYDIELKRFVTWEEVYGIDDNGGKAKNAKDPFTEAPWEDGPKPPLILDQEKLELNRAGVVDPAIPGQLASVLRNFRGSSESSNENSKDEIDNVVNFTRRPKRSEETFKSRPFYRDHKGQPVTREEFDKLTKLGCYGCGADLSWGDRVKFAKSDVGTVISMGDCCYDDQHLMNHLGFSLKA